MELKPCPFCGGEAKKRLKVFKVEPDCILSSLFYQCQTCLAQTRAETIRSPRISNTVADCLIVMDAIDQVDDRIAEAWNRRV